MEISNPRQVDLGDGYLALDVDLDGITVRIGTEQKPTLVEHGILAVNDDRFTARIARDEPAWEAIGTTRLTTCVRDPQLMELWRALVAS